MSTPLAAVDFEELVKLKDTALAAKVTLQNREVNDRSDCKNERQPHLAPLMENWLHNLRLKYAATVL